MDRQQQVYEKQQKEREKASVSKVSNLTAAITLKEEVEKINILKQTIIDQMSTKLFCFNCSDENKNENNMILPNENNLDENKTIKEKYRPAIIIGNYNKTTTIILTGTTKSKHLSNVDESENLFTLLFELNLGKKINKFPTYFFAENIKQCDKRLVKNKWDTNIILDKEKYGNVIVSKLSPEHLKKLSENLKEIPKTKKYSNNGVWSKDETVLVNSLNCNSNDEKSKSLTIDKPIALN